MYNFTCKTSQLKVGDVVKVYDGEFGTGTIRKIDCNLVHITRPYTHMDENTNICYTGVEEFTRSMGDKQDWLVYRRHRRRKEG